MVPFFACGKRHVYKNNLAEVQDRIFEHDAALDFPDLEIEFLVLRLVFLVLRLVFQFSQFGKFLIAVNLDSLSKFTGPLDLVCDGVFVRFVACLIHPVVVNDGCRLNSFESACFRSDRVLDLWSWRLGFWAIVVDVKRRDSIGQQNHLLCFFVAFRLFAQLFERFLYIGDFFPFFSFFRRQVLPLKISKRQIRADIFDNCCRYRSRYRYRYPLGGAAGLWPGRFDFSELSDGRF